MRRFAALTATGISACAQLDTGSPFGTVGAGGTASGQSELTNDWPFEIPDPPDGGEQIRTPVYTIPAGEERTFCLWGEWSETQGVNFYEWFQDVVFSHHLRMDSVFAGVAEEPGTVTDCSDGQNTLQAELRPLFNATEPGLQVGKGRMVLDDGMGVMVDEGDPWVIQSHYTNYSGDDIQVQDIINLGYLPAEEVTRPLSTWTMNNVGFEVASGETEDVTFECTWEQDATVEMWMVHMHDYATKFVGTMVPADGSESIELVHYDPWDPEMRYLPQLLRIAGGLPVKAGDVFRGTCTFFNRDPQPLGFPQEMCVLEGTAWPMTEPFLCDVGTR